MKPRIVAYRDYKHFDHDTFLSDIQSCLKKYIYMKCFKESRLCIFNKHVPIKRKYARADEALFMIRELHKAIMKKSKLKNKFLELKSITDWKNCNVQQNYCKSI